jgi:hypothetical protein
MGDQLPLSKGAENVRVVNDEEKEQVPADVVEEKENVDPTSKEVAQNAEVVEQESEVRDNLSSEPTMEVDRGGRSLTDGIPDHVLVELCDAAAQRMGASFRSEVAEHVMRLLAKDDRALEVIVHVRCRSSHLICVV